MPPKYTLQEYQEALNYKYHHKIRAFAYNGSSHLVEHFCNKHKENFYAKPINLLHNCSNKNGCNICKSNILKKLGRSKRLSQQMYVKLCKQKNLVPIQNYKTRFTKIKHRCLLCNHVWNTIPDTIIQGSGKCERCLMPHKFKTIEDWKNEVVDKLMVLKQSTTHLKVQCLQCGKKSSKPKKTLHKNPDCKHCSAISNGKANRVSYKEFCKRLKKRYNHLVLKTSEKDFDGINKPLTLFCASHKIKFEDIGYNYSTNKYHVGCPKCVKSRKQTTYKNQPLFIQGYEHFALSWLKSNKKHIYNTICIKDSKPYCPIISYTLKKKKCKYTPDFFSEQHNCILEIKSPYTLTRNEDIYEKNVAKYKRMKESRYKYKILVFDNLGNRIKLPKEWFNYDYMELRKLLLDNNVIV